MDNFISKEEIIDQLWSAYTKTKDYKAGYTEGILSYNPLLIKQEKKGLKRIYIHFVENLNRSNNSKLEIRIRKVSDWLLEWKNMHTMLFEFVLKNRGDWRKKDVRFGSPGDEDLYKIPHYKEVPRQMNELAYQINNYYLKSTDKLSDNDKLKILAQIHFQFIRIHPFNDGNGRIARALTDQLAIYFDYPVAMAGYPRLDDQRRINYHKAIKSCIYDPECKELADWIKGYIDQRLSTLA